MLERDLRVTSKGLKGKEQEPYVVFSDEHGNKFTCMLDSPGELSLYEIALEVTVQIVKGKQAKLQEG